MAYLVIDQSPVSINNCLLKSRGWVWP